MMGNGRTEMSEEQPTSRLEELIDKRLREGVEAAYDAGLYGGVEVDKKQTGLEVEDGDG